MRALTVRVAFAALVAGAVITCSLNAQQPATPELTAQDLRDGLKNPTRWLTYSGNYANHRHSPLTQITPENVHRLTAQWQFQTDTLGKFEAAPLVFDGVIYVTGPLDTGWAIDARSGRQIWRYRRDLPGGLIACCGLVNRGFVLGDRLFKTTLDAHVVAISRKTGVLEWDTAMAPYRNGYSGTTAPLVVKDKVLVGVAGAEYGVRGFIDAYDVQSGKQVWRFYTTAGPDDPGHGTWRGTDNKAWEHGGGSIWVPGAYDPDLNLVYWGTGNAGPDFFVNETATTEIYTASIVALDADTGKAPLALPVDPPRCVGLGLDADAGTRRPDTQRRGSQGRVVRQPQRFLLRPRPRDRQTDQGQTVHRDDVGEGDSARRAADAPAQHSAQRGRHEGLSRSIRWHELDATVARSGARPLLRDGT
jgi:alcohol dehydrogenase (cytochrome c)